MAHMREEHFVGSRLKLVPRSLVLVAVLLAAMVSTAGSPVAASDPPILPGGILKTWTFILEFPSGNSNAITLMTLQTGQLAGTAVIGGKNCAFHISGTFTGNVNTGGSFAMTWTDQRACEGGDVLTLNGDIVSHIITGTFTDTNVPGGPFALTGTARR